MLFSFQHCIKVVYEQVRDVHLILVNYNVLKGHFYFVVNLLLFSIFQITMYKEVKRKQAKVSGL